MAADSLARIREALELELRGAVRYFDEAGAQELTKLAKRAIRHYSRHRPLIKQSDLVLTEGQSDYDTPDDFMGVKDIRATDSTTGFITSLREKGVRVNWTLGLMEQTGAWEQEGRQWIRFNLGISGTVVLTYFGYHEEDGTTLKEADVEDVELKAKELAFSSIVSSKLDICSVQAGPVSFDSVKEAQVWQLRFQYFRDQFEKKLSDRGFGSRSSGYEFNAREVVTTTQGEIIY